MAGTTVLASVSSSGEMANDESANVVGFDPSLGVTYSADTIAISADGRYVAFSSRATNLVEMSKPCETLPLLMMWNTTLVFRWLTDL